MIRALLLLVVMAALPVHARLGETLTECEGRYGQVVEKAPAKMKESDPDACLFSKSGITIIVEFKAGKAWKVLYRMASMDAGSVETLLGVESSEGGWSQPIEVGTQKVRISDDHDRLAIHQPGRRPEDVSTMTFVTKAFAAANREDYEAKLALIPEEVRRRNDNRPMKDL